MGIKQRRLIGITVLGLVLGLIVTSCGGLNVPVEYLPPDSRTVIFDATPTRVYLATLDVLARKWIDVVRSDEDQGLIVFKPVYHPSSKAPKRNAPAKTENLWGEDLQPGSTFLTPLPKAEPTVESPHSDLDPYVKTGVLEPAAQALLLTLEPLDGYRTRATVSGVFRDAVTYSTPEFETDWYPDYPGVQVRDKKLKGLFKEIRKALSTASRVKQTVDLH